MISWLIAIVVVSGLLFTLPLSVLGLALSTFDTVAPRLTRERMTALARRAVGHLTVARLAFGLLAAELMFWNVTGSPTYVEDEGTYTAQAWSIFHGHFAPYFYTYDHPPLAWLQMAPFLPAIHLIAPGLNAVEVARFVMAVAAVVDIALLAVIVHRLRLNAAVAWATLAFTLTSPLTQEYVRHVYIDNIALPWMLAALALVVGRGGSRRYWLAGIFMGISALSKETMLLVWPAIAMAAWTNAGTPGWVAFKKHFDLETDSAAPAHRRRRETSSGRLLRHLRSASGDGWSAADRQRDALKSLTLGTFLVGILYPMMALFLGEHGQLWHEITYQLVGRVGSGSVFTHGSARFSIVHHWIEADWVLLVFGLGCGALTVLMRRLRWIPVALAVPLIQVGRTGGYLPYMAVIVLLPFLGLGIAAIGTELVRRLNGIARVGLIVLMVGASLVTSIIHIRDTRLSDRQNTSVNSAIQWVEKRTPENSRVLADDVVFAALTQHGRSDVWKQSVYVYKLDYDPQAKRRIPNGWRDIDYVVETPMFLGSLDPGMRQARLAYRHSVPVVAFGSGATKVTVRRVIDTPASQRGS